jgi:ATP-dependent DNA helicase RecG
MPDQIVGDRDSIDKAGHSLGNARHSLGNEGHSLGNEAQLQQIAQPARDKKRLPPQEMRRILLELCNGRWLSRARIAQLVGRNSEDLRHRFINPLISEGLLRLRYPDTPHRTDQAYRKVDGDASDVDDE